MRRVRALSLALVPALVSGCATTLGDMLSDLNADYIVPAILGTSDVSAGCASGEALGALVISFAPYSRKASRSTVVPRTSAGMCLEGLAWDAELEAMRAYNNGDIPASKDARIRESRYHHYAATRYLGAYRVLEQEYGVPGPDDACPNLKTDSDTLIYMIGLSSGVLAIVHDAGASGSAGVPTSIGPAVVRGAACLDDDRWWGAPRAMQAALWALQPDAPGAEDPWSTFEASVAKGEASAVRLAGAFYAQAAATVDNEERLRDAIRRDVASREASTADPSWQMLDAYAGLIIQHESDRIWTEATGHRTPIGDMGAFPDDAQEDIELDDDLFDGLDLFEDAPPADEDTQSN
jgi:hypothetical protein